MSKPTLIIEFPAAAELPDALAGDQEFLRYAVDLSVELDASVIRQR